MGFSEWKTLQGVISSEGLVNYMDPERFLGMEAGYKRRGKDKLRLQQLLHF